MSQPDRDEPRRRWTLRGDGDITGARTVVDGPSLRKFEQVEVVEVVESREPCRVCGGRGWHTAGGNDPAACSCPAGEAWYSESREPFPSDEDTLGRIFTEAIWDGRGDHPWDVMPDSARRNYKTGIRAVLDAVSSHRESSTSRDDRPEIGGCANEGEPVPEGLRPTGMPSHRDDEARDG